MSISSSGKRILYFQSGGYCQNPSCNCELFKFFESGKVTDIEELAHIIAQKGDGPRGNDEKALSERDLIDNIILLCPSCHTIIDKNPEEYSKEALFRWKSEHTNTIAACFKVPIYKNRKELRVVIQNILRRNKTIFETYGPFSAESKNLLTDSNEVWNRKCIDTIIPNNRKIIQLLNKNEYLLYDCEKDIVEQFIIHAEAFEYNKFSGDKNSSAPVFPVEINDILREVK